MKEALEANEWEDGVGNEDSGSSLDLGDEAQAGFEVEATEMEGEIMSLKTSIYEVGKKLLDEDHERDMEDGDDIQVQGLEILMSRMQAIKGMPIIFSGSWIQLFLKHNIRRITAN